MSIHIVLNGNRNDKIIPKTIRSIVESAVLAIDKDVGSIHFHPRDNEGNEIHNGKLVDNQIEELRKSWEYPYWN